MCGISFHVWFCCSFHGDLKFCWSEGCWRTSISSFQWAIFCKSCTTWEIRLVCDRRRRRGFSWCSEFCQKIYELSPQKEMMNCKSYKSSIRLCCKLLCPTALQTFWKSGRAIVWFSQAWCTDKSFVRRNVMVVLEDTELARSTENFKTSLSRYTSSLVRGLTSFRKLRFWNLFSSKSFSLLRCNTAL